MIGYTNQQIPPPKYWQEFEDLCADLWRKIWKDENTQKNGRGGQPQHGVDVFGRIGGSGNWQGGQCKGKDGLYGNAVTEKELKDEVEKAKKFKPPIKNFILATTAPNDSKIQEVARQLTEINKIDGKFSVSVFGWEEIQRRLAEHLDVFRLYYPYFVPKQQLHFETLEEQIDKILKSTEKSGALTSTLGKQINRLIELGISQDSLLPEISDKADKADEAIKLKIDEYRDLIEEKPKTALELLEKLKGQCWESASDYIKFRITANIGAAYRNLGNKERAIENLLSAEQYAPGDGKALQNRALAFVLAGKYEDAKIAAKLALEKVPDNFTSYALLIAASTDDLTIDDLSILVPSELIDHPTILNSLAYAYQYRGNIKRALPYFEKAYKSSPDSIRYCASFADALFFNLFEHEPLRFGNQLRNEEKDKLNQAAKIYRKIWDEIQDREIVDAYIPSFINLCSIYSLTGRADESWAILNKVLIIAPDNTEALKLAALFSLYKGNSSQDLSILRSYTQRAQY